MHVLARFLNRLRRSVKVTCYGDGTKQVLVLTAAPVPDAHRRLRAPRQHSTSARMPGQEYYSCINIITNYHDFLSPPMWGSHVKSDNTHIIINIHPLAHLLDICPLVFSGSALFSLSQQHHVTASHPLQVITTRAR